MIEEAHLKSWIHRPLNRADKSLIILSSFNQPVRIKELINKGKKVGLRVISQWNLSSILKRTNGLAINTDCGWEISPLGIEHLAALGVTKISPEALKVAVDFRSHLSLIKNGDTKAFVEEAIKCYEMGLYRSAVVMSWLAAIHTLYGVVHDKHLAAFNAEALRVDKKWKAAAAIDDFGRMKESDFLDRISALSLIGKNIKDELVKCLKLRNGCGHPNSLKIGANAAAGHIEILLLNVFKKFSPP